MTVRVRRDERAAVAQTLAGTERAHVWSQLCERNRRLAALQRKAGRELPVVRLVMPRG